VARAGVGVGRRGGVDRGVGAVAVGVVRKALRLPGGAAARRCSYAERFLNPIRAATTRR
jgi:hypothetical protein